MFIHNTLISLSNFNNTIVIYWGVGLSVLELNCQYAVALLSGHIFHTTALNLTILLWLQAPHPGKPFQLMD